jgi:hypothetical protein
MASVPDGPPKMPGWDRQTDANANRLHPVGVWKPVANLYPGL